MSYCRFSNADIYVFPSDRGFECCGCPTENMFVTDKADEMLRHMDAHRKDGLEVPDYAFEGVFEDRHMYVDEPAS